MNARRGGWENGRRGNAWIGTSGWSYPHWRGVFYPQDLPSSRWLAHYAARFPAVEINNTFYQLPEDTSLEAWRNAVPDDFRFTVKASRYITHTKKLKDPERTLEAFLHSIETLESRLGPLLFQLPPRWQFNVERLESFLDTLGSRHQAAFEFRDPSWFDERVYERLAEHGASLCIYDLDGFESPHQVTADFVYVRLHGPEGAYHGSYGHAALGRWSRLIEQWLADGLEVWCFFDNDEQGYATHDAARLQSRLYLSPAGNARSAG